MPPTIRPILRFPRAAGARRLWLLALAGALASLVLYLVTIPRAQEPDPTARDAWQSLVTPSPELVSDGVSPLLVDQLGYRPQARSGLTVRPDGDCSSPVPLPDEFTPACQQHDYGYDLLRAAEAAGGRLGPEARRSIDRQFAATLQEACTTRPAGTSTVRCKGAAVVASGAVRVNSWRQHESVPGREDATSIAMLAAASLTSLALMVLTARAAWRDGRGRRG